MTVARKEHTCDICLHPITPGTDYLAQRVTPWDYEADSDSFYTWRCHWCCARLGDTYMRDLHEDSYTVDALTDWVWEVARMSIPDLLRVIAGLAAQFGDRPPGGHAMTQLILQIPCLTAAQVIAAADALIAAGETTITTDDVAGHIGAVDPAGKRRRCDDSVLVDALSQHPRLEYHGWSLSEPWVGWVRQENMR